jgi:hypothetical protein
LRPDTFERKKMAAGAPLDQARQRLAEDALSWLAKDALPAEIYPAWALSGIGESTLGIAGETQLRLKTLADN